MDYGDYYCGLYIGTTIGIHSPHSLLIKHQGEVCRVQVGRFDRVAFSLASAETHFVLELSFLELLFLELLFLDLLFPELLFLELSFLLFCPSNNESKARIQESLSCLLPYTLEQAISMFFPGLQGWGLGFREHTRVFKNPLLFLKTLFFLNPLLF